jgi:hypothetical protein
MLRPLASYKTSSDFGASISFSVCGRDSDGDLLIRIEIEAEGQTKQIELTKWHFTQLIGDICYQLQKI